MIQRGKPEDLHDNSECLGDVSSLRLKTVTIGKVAWHVLAPTWRTQIWLVRCSYRDAMKTSTLKRFLSVVAVSLAVFGAVDQAEAKPKTTSSAVVEIASPPPDFNTSAAALRTAAESEIRKEGSLLKSRRKLVISVALVQTGAAPVAVSVNATVRDAKTGAMIAIVETAARAEGPLSPELRKEMADAAVRSAVRRVPGALRAKKG